MNQKELMDTVTAIDIDDNGRVKSIVGKCKAGDFQKPLYKPCRWCGSTSAAEYDDDETLCSSCGCSNPR